jgi:hypothetical protein
LAYQPPASNAFLSEQISHQQLASNTLLSEQTSTSHQPTEQAAKQSAKTKLIVISKNDLHSYYYLCWTKCERPTYPRLELFIHQRIFQLQGKYRLWYGHGIGGEYGWYSIAPDEA